MLHNIIACGCTVAGKVSRQRQGKARQRQSFCAKVASILDEVRFYIQMISYFLSSYIYKTSNYIKLYEKHKLALLIKNTFTFSYRTE